MEGTEEKASLTFRPGSPKKIRARTSRIIRSLGYLLAERLYLASKQYLLVNAEQSETPEYKNLLTATAYYEFMVLRKRS